VRVNAFGSDGPYIFASSGRDIFRNLPTGGTWTNMHLSLSDTNEGKAQITSFTSCGGYLFVGSDSNGIYRSELDGRGYRRFNAGLTDSTVLELQSNGNTVYAATSGGLFASMDFGVSWNAINTEDTPILNLSVDDNTIYLGTSIGVFVSSDNGGHWSFSSHGFDYAPISALFVSSGYLFTGTDYGNFRSSSGGSAWTLISNGPMTNLSATSFTNVGNNIFAGTDDGVFLTTDNGDHWSNSTDSLPYMQVDRLTASDSFLFVTVLEKFYDRIAHVFLSLDTGKSWNAFDSLNTATTSITQGSFTYVAGYPSTGVVYQTTNNGIWTEADSGIREFGIYGGNASNVETLVPSGESIFAGTDDGIYLTTNNGFSWTKIGSLPSTSARFTALYLRDNYFIATTNDGVFASMDSGVTWIETDSGLANTSKNISASAVQDSFLYVGIQRINLTGQEVGLFRRSIAEIEQAVKQGRDQAPVNEVRVTAGFEVDIRSYPNPFSQSTAISFTIPESGPAQITILNLLGAEVARVYDGKLSAGEHSFTWDARGAAPGMYECIVRTGGRTSETPMVLLR